MRGLARMHLPERQRGAALLILLALFAVGAAYMLVSSLNKSSVALSLARADHNREVMQEAKAALIAWSAAKALRSTTLVPGALPCPDIVNKGTAPGTCASAAQLGRLPYIDLGIRDLRDASGERLWYAVSDNFRTGASTINSDIPGTIAVSGVAPTNVVAVILAPGMRLGTQNRSPDEATCAANNNPNQPCNIAVNYLEGLNGDNSANDFELRTEKLSIDLNDPPGTILFNDQVLAITQQDLLSAIEPLIAARIRLTNFDIVADYIYNNDPALTDSNHKWSDANNQRDKTRYFDAWGGFPFAAPFVNQTGGSPSVCTPPSIYTGQAPTREGLLPVVNCLSYNWSSGTISKSGGGGSPSCSVANGGSDLICRISYSGFSTPTIHMTGTVPGVGLSFVQLTQLGDVNIDYSSLSARTLSGSLDNAGNGIVTLDATLPWSFFNRTVNITMNNGNLLTSPLIEPADSVAGWFIKNGWYKQTYYAVSPGFSGGNASCPGTNPCLSVNNLPAPNANPTTDTRAILVFAGRSLSGATRPNGNLPDYLEGQNASPGDYTFEHASNKTTMVLGAPAAINDRVIVIAP